MSKEDKNNWKQRQRELPKKQNSQNTHQSLRQQEAEDRRRTLRSVKMIFSAIGLIVLLLTSYGIWQYYDGQKPPTIGGAAAAPDISQSTASAPNFSLKDINGTQVSLNQLKGKVIGIHFMAVGCKGQINPINEYQLTQLSTTCKNLCKLRNATFITVAVATCENSQLDVLRSNYDVSWILGNDYSDGALEIVNSYVPFEIGDGTVVLLDKNSNIAQVYNGGVAASVLVSKINALSGA